MNHYGTIKKCSGDVIIGPNDLTFYAVGSKYFIVYTHDSIIFRKINEMDG